MSDISDASHWFWTKLTRFREPPSPAPPVSTFQLSSPPPSSASILGHQISDAVLVGPSQTHPDPPSSPSKPLQGSSPFCTPSTVPPFLGFSSSSLQAFALPPFHPNKAALSSGKVWLLKSLLTDRQHMFHPFTEVKSDSSTPQGEQLVCKTLATTY